MRYIEIFLKLAFLAISVYFIATQSVLSPAFNLLLIVCIVLGLTLMFNRESSYKFRHTKKDWNLRHIEGGILILFAVITSSVGL